MSLKQYFKKRNLKKSKEPTAVKKIKKENKKLIFVVQEHYASHLHYDLRLEINNVLKSWAIPKKPSTKKGIKRLAIQVEDHPLDYANFEGIIPKGNYGAGKVKIWDKGTYELIKKNSKEIEFKLNGKKLKGEYVLIKMNFKDDKRKNSWLFFKV